jgi:hypothetical protein
VEKSELFPPKSELWSKLTVKIYRKETIRYEKETVTGAICDWCKTEMARPEGHATEEFVLRCVIGERYGADGGWEKGWEVEDLCRECASKLRKLLEENGIRTVNTEVDW